MKINTMSEQQRARLLTAHRENTLVLVTYRTGSYSSAAAADRSGGLYTISTPHGEAVSAAVDDLLTCASEHLYAAGAQDMASVYYDKLSGYEYCAYELINNRRELFGGF